MRFCIAIVSLLFAGDAHARVHQTYAAAIHAQQRTGQPLVVIVGAAWCGPCQRLKAELPSVTAQAEIVYVDYDRDRNLALAVLGGRSRGLPTIVLWKMLDGQVERRNSVGYMSAADLDSFIVGRIISRRLVGERCW